MREDRIMRTSLLALALMTACSSGRSTTIEDLPASMVDAICDRYVTCGILDAGRCDSIVIETRITPSLVAAVQAGKVIFHEDQARACLDAIGAGSCARRSLGLLAEACDLIFEGTIAEAAACAMDEECISEFCNITVGGCTEQCCTGTCIGSQPPLRPPHVGEECTTNSLLPCYDSWCNFAVRECIAYTRDNAGCTDSGQCASGLCSNGTCKPLAKLGEPCELGHPLGDCERIGYTCNQSTQICVELGLSDDTCSTAGNTCSPFYDCTAGSCVLGPLIGDTCLANDGPFCLDGSYCDSMQSACVALKPDGMVCGIDWECESGHCPNGTCTAQPICI